MPNNIFYWQTPEYGIAVEATRRGLNGVTAKLESHKLFQQARESLQDILDELKGRVVDTTPVARGITAENIFTKIEGDTLDDLNGIVASPDEWFKVLEFGRRAGSRMPPQQPIEEWMGIKGMDIKYQFIVRRNIAERGTPALHIMQRALQDSRSKFSTIWFRRFLSDWGNSGSSRDS